jgi:hypothetical protein
MFDERTHNYPAGYKEKPWCPHTQLVQIGASLAGIELTPETFCTERVENAVYLEGIPHWIDRADFIPAASCAKLNRELLEQLKLVKEEVLLTPDSVVNRELDRAAGFDAKKAVIDKYKSERERHSKKQEIFTRWRKVVFETSISTSSDENNEHFRQFKSADELSGDEIIDKVEQFTSALNKITGYEPDVVRSSRGAENCPQSPKYHHVGPWID